MSSIDLSHEEKKTLLYVARASIEHGLENSTRLALNIDDYPDSLQKPLSTFVTLHNASAELRGCIGSLQVTQPLVKDVAIHAYSAAFNDMRFEPVTQAEFKELEIEISILTPQTPLSFNTEDELLAQLDVGVSGLTIEDLGHRATFLPSVWKQLPDKNDFVKHLKQKAGLSETHWSKQLSAYAYTTISFSEAEFKS